MTALKLGRLPDRTPIKLAIAISPDLAADLDLYARLYRERYDRDEPVAELVPAMLALFLDSDRAFVQARRAAQAASP